MFEKEKLRQYFLRYVVQGGFFWRGAERQGSGAMVVAKGRWKQGDMDAQRQLGGIIS